MSLRIKVPIPVWIALGEFSNQSKLVLAEVPSIYMLVAGNRFLKGLVEVCSNR